VCDTLDCAYQHTHKKMYLIVCVCGGGETVCDIDRAYQYTHKQMCLIMGVCMGERQCVCDTLDCAYQHTHTHVCVCVYVVYSRARTWWCITTHTHTQNRV